MNMINQIKNLSLIDRKNHVILDNDVGIYYKNNKIVNHCDIKKGLNLYHFNLIILKDDLSISDIINTKSFTRIIFDIEIDLSKYLIDIEDHYQFTDLYIHVTSIDSKSLDLFKIINDNEYVRNNFLKIISH